MPVAETSVDTFRTSSDKRSTWDGHKSLLMYTWVWLGQADLVCRNVCATAAKPSNWALCYSCVKQGMNYMFPVPKEG